MENISEAAVKTSRRAFAFLVEKKEIDLWEFF